MALLDISLICTNPANDGPTTAASAAVRRRRRRRQL
jgi:hypothetical protein